MNLEAYIVNAFTNNLAEGNPAGVVSYTEALAEDLMQKIALDIGKSETAFIQKISTGQYAIRWFSPIKEMPICGHATLAAAKVIFEREPISEISFSYSAGSIIVKKSNDRLISMQFPLDEYDTLAIDTIYYAFFPAIDIKECIIGRKTKKVILITSESTDIRSIQPNFGLMRNSSGVFGNGIGISKISKQYDFESRYFNPWAGVDEDPITGSVHTVIARYWCELLNKKHLIAIQRSQRPGILDLVVVGEFLHISGDARIVLGGTIRI